MCTPTPDRARRAPRAAITASITAAITAALSAGAAWPQAQTPQPFDASARPRLGQPAAPVPRAVRNAFPDGQGLPPGRGTAREADALYQQQCAACHGETGRGGPGGELVGRETLAGTQRPDKTVGSYWPHATTVFDYLRRAMPVDRPGSLSDDQAYALTAWLLAANGIIDRDAVIDARTLPQVRMPNRGGFVRHRDTAPPGAPAAAQPASN